ncbi:MAG TPA: hypothetical protein VMQ61_17770 [Thermoanaerobaculia bacterium]|nr:hypothetical protein [Thermoanaerobaculia bacterium]
MRKGSGPSLGLRALALLTGSLVLTGESCSRGAAPPPAPTDYFQILLDKVDDARKKNPGKDVAIAVVTKKNGKVQVDPDTLILKDGAHVVVWLVVGTSPKFTFGAGTHPFEVDCQNFLCFSRTVASTGGQSQLDIDYDIAFTAIGGAPVKADPHLEVVK